LRGSNLLSKDEKTDEIQDYLVKKQCDHTDIIKLLELGQVFEDSLAVLWRVFDRITRQPQVLELRQ
jgi:hypothetical protein